MKNFIITVIAAATLAISSTGCRSNREVASHISATSMETVSLGNNGDGSIVVRAWGSGANKGESIEQAKRNALNDILFKGIKKGSNPGEATRPLVPEVNAREKYADYFEPFFSSGGKYTKFAHEDHGNSDRLKSKGVSREAYGVVLVINRSALRNQLIKDGVLSK